MEKVILIIFMLLCSININAQFKTDTIVSNDTTFVINETVTIKQKVVYFEDDNRVEGNLAFYFVNDKDSTYTNVTVTDNEGRLLYANTGNNFVLIKESYRGNVNYYIYDQTKDSSKYRFKIGYLTTLKEWLIGFE